MTPAARSAFLRDAHDHEIDLLLRDVECIARLLLDGGADVGDIIRTIDDVIPRSCPTSSLGCGCSPTPSRDSDT